MTTFRVREAVAADRRFVESMLVEAANAPHGTASAHEVLSDPRTAQYVVGWPRDTDVSLVAETSAGEAIGAVWLRFFTAEQPAFGFVAADIPELALGVVAPWRGRGVGGRLLGAIAATARRRGIAAISLSVETANPAVRLYESHGYQTVRRNEHAQQMVVHLGEDPAGEP